MLLIDRLKVDLIQKNTQNMTQVSDIGANKVLIGGINTTDPRFTIYKSYSGCLSSKNKSALISHLH